MLPMPYIAPCVAMRPVIVLQKLAPTSPMAMIAKPRYMQGLRVQGKRCMAIPRNGHEKYETPIVVVPMEAILED